MATGVENEVVSIKFPGGPLFLRLAKPEINGGALARTYPSRVVLGALEFLLEPVEVRLGLLQRRLRLLLLQLVLSGRRLKQKIKERGSVINA